ncbi:hypothetical protein [Rhodococcus sp. NPDC057529]|uniref:hypothetical protein n=1 Tax=Rhodococcus sp. NPDC057529 TaxID=3346158 RepID=UPI00366BDA7E
MSVLDIDSFEKIAQRDPEFNREIRYFDGQIELNSDDEAYVLEITDGVLARARRGAAEESRRQIQVSGPRNLWDAMLEDKPKPFHHSLQSCAVKHGLQISDNNVTYAYLPALNRMMQILRAVHNEEH